MSEPTCCCERHERVNEGKPCPFCKIHGRPHNLTEDVHTLREMAERWGGRMVRFEGHDWDFDMLLSTVADLIEESKP